MEGVEAEIAENETKIADINMKLARESKIDTEIITVKGKQQDILDMEKINMDTNINPAAFEKSQSERVAEANSIFQQIINNSAEPHITFPFERIGDFNDVNQLFVEESTGRISNMVLIIYRSQETFGHWVGLTRSKDLRRLTYFNSYGAYIDRAIEHIPEEFRDQSKQNFPFLLKLLNESNYEIHWNDKQLQQMSNDIATCGRWVGYWMLQNRKGKTLEEFVTPFLSIPLEERDEIIYKLTEPYLQG